ncbi:MAG: lysostaphin resistance A-like protein [Candidatus Acidiferrales bacterium]
MTRIFLGPEGLRVVWRLVIAISLWFVLSGVLPMLVIWIPGVRALLTHVSARMKLTPAILLFTDGITASAALLTALIMTRIEKRSFAAYGLPGRAAFGKRFWVGALYGFAMISLLMGLIAALHGFSVHGLSLHALSATRYGFLYFAGFITVAIFEEFAFRGYLQSTLQLAIGFWPAAAILAVAFGAIHLGNPGEGKYGAIMAAFFGLLAAFTLRRTGSIWFAIGLHTMWDWGETFFYSVRDSGVPAAGHLMNSGFHGPTWLTGGTVGPEGSLIVFGVLGVSALALHFLFPASGQLQ